MERLPKSYSTTHFAGAAFKSWPPNTMTLIGMVKKKILVLCVDRDNDLYTKAKIGGPVIGREANIEAATKLALADPEETDANTIFEALRLHDELGKDHEVQIATLSGSERLGYAADREILKQLERVLGEFPCDSCIFVSDGASDEQVIPIIQSRLKIDSVRVVVMKQAKELEKTYFVLLEKLKEPHYARLIFGIPALVLLLLAVGDLLGLGWRLAVFAMGAYLLAKGFGIEERVLDWLGRWHLPMERISLILYIPAVILIAISFVQAYEAYNAKLLETSDQLKVTAFAVTKLLLLLPWGLALLLLGKILDLLHDKERYGVVKYGLYGISVFILWLILSIASKWVLAEVYFSEFVFTVLASIVLTFLAVRVMDWIKLRIAMSMRLENKEVLTELGAYVGKTVGVDRRKGILIVQTALGQKLDLAFERIVGIGDRVIVRH